jgi:hypothetical protein
MTHWKLSGDVLLTLNEDGSLEAKSTAGARAKVSLEEAAALHVARSYWGGGAGGGAREEAIRDRLATWGMATDPTALLAGLAAKGFLQNRGKELTAPERKKLPVFFIYCPRSGSNMLRWLLDAHPVFSCPPPSVIAHLLVSATNHNLSGAAFRSMRSPKAWSRRMLRSWIEKQMDEVVRREKKERWIYRHWVTYRSLHYIEELFGGNVLYICLVRHGLDVADAACRVYVPAETWQAGPNGMETDYFKYTGGSYHLAYANFWKEIAERMLQFRSLHPDRVHVVRYEDLVEKPDHELSRALTFLGEEMPRGLIEKAFQKPARMLAAWEGHELTRTSKIEKDRVGLHRLWEPNLIKLAAPVVNDQLEQFGYPRVVV